MNRRRTFAALAIAALVTIGPGPRAESYDLRQTCKTDLAAIFKLCDPQGSFSGCKDVANEEMAAACQAACVKVTCPEQIACTELDPIWCGTSCANPRGATYWVQYWKSFDACDFIFEDPDRRTPATDLEQCMKAERLGRCPELADIDLEELYWEMRGQNDPSYESCGTEDIEGATARCKKLDCAGVLGEFMDGCMASCMRSSCPLEFWPSKTDPIWRHSCADMHGAPFWRNLDRARLRCNAKLHVYSTEVDRATRLACLQRQAEEDCPALAGTDWWDHRP
jgi:hypothetical protein